VTNQKTQNTTITESAKSAASIDEQGVADYLRRHPGFFEDKPTLLADLRVPHTAGAAVSLVERQVAVLRESNANLHKQLEGLLHVARTNDTLNALLHKFTLRMVKCESLDTLLDLVSKKLRQDFSADMVAVCLLAKPKDKSLASHAAFLADADAFRGLFQRLLGAGKPYCGQLKKEQLDALFGEQAEGVLSSAVLPLGMGGELGIVAIGSFERDRYHTDVDTAFLQNMSEVIAATLGKHLDMS
jgi:uncharacterized protein YigA (DUF484 family)